MKRTFILMITFVGLLTSCSRQPSRWLLTLNELSNQKPDSVATVLNNPSIQSALRSKKDKITARLIQIKVKDKLDQSIEKDSDILDILLYFEKNRETSLLTEAYYYAGRYYITKHDVPKALDLYLKARECTDKSTKTLPLQNVIESQLGYIYMEQSLYDDALACFKKSYSIAEKLDDSKTKAHGLRDIGTCMGYMERSDEALTYNIKAYNLANNSKDTVFAAETCGQIARWLNYKKQFQKAEHYLRIALTYSTRSTRPALYAIATDTYMGLNLLDSVKTYCHYLLGINDIQAKEYAYCQLALAETKETSPRDWKTYYKKYLEYHDSTRCMIDTESIAKAKAMYDYSMVNIEKVRLEKKNTHQQMLLIIFALIFIMSCLVMTAVYYISRQKRQFLRLKLQAYKERLLVAQQEQERKNTHANYAITREEFFPNGSREKLSEERWKELTERIKTIDPEFKVRLMELYKMDEHSYRMCVLIRMGVTPTEIASIMCITKSAISNQRKRLYEKAFGEEGSPTDWDNIVKAI